MSTKVASDAAGEMPDKVLPRSGRLFRVTLLILSTITLYIVSVTACREYMSNITTATPTSTSGKALNVHISYGGGDDDSQMTELYKNLTTDHNIRSLSLKVAEHGCMVTANPFAFSFRPGDRFPPLTTVRLGGYDFHNTNEAVRERWRLRTTGIRGWRLYLVDEYDYEWLRPIQVPLKIDKGSNLRLWMKAMDWSHVERLELANVDLHKFFVHMSGNLHALKELAFVPRTVAGEKQKTGGGDRGLPRHATTAKESFA